MVHSSTAGTVYTVYTQYCCGEHGRHPGVREDNADNTAKSSIYPPGGGDGDREILLSFRVLV